MYTLLALDIDDTLLNDQRELSPQNKAAIAKAVEAGVTVTIATGRAYCSARAICEKIDLPAIPVITFGGAQIVEYPTDERIYLDALEPETVKEVLAYCKERGVYGQAYCYDDFYFEQKCEESEYYTNRLGYRGTECAMSEMLFDRSAKCLAILEPDQVSAFLAEAKAHFDGRLCVVQSHSRFVEFYKADVNKGTALKWLGERLGIAREEMIAMGDSGIDIPMIEYAGLGIAVGNATQETKDAANLITIPANDSAVAAIIEKYILR